MLRVFIVLVALSFLGCSKPLPPPQNLIETAPEPSPPPSTSATTQRSSLGSDMIQKRVDDAKTRLSQSEAGKLLWSSIEAHGGLQRWFENGHLSFRFTYHPVGKAANDTRQVVDIWSSRARHEVVGKEVSYGWDGGQAWILPPDGDAGTNVRFWSLTPFYFVGVPFVLADSGVILEVAGEVEFEGVRYQTVKVSFEPGTGDAPDDFYVVYIHPETKRVGGVRYVVSYPGFFPEGGHTPEKWMSYDGEQVVSGIVFPERFRTFTWDGKAHGEVSTNTTMTEVSWVKDADFEVPLGAKILEGF